MVVLILLITSAVPQSAAAAPKECACGTKQVLLVLADFPDFPHLSSRLEITRLFFGQVSRYLEDVSYGKLSINGNATDWISLPRLYAQYASVNQVADLPSIAHDAFVVAAENYNMTSFDYYFLVLSFYQSATADYIRLSRPLTTRSGSITSLVVVEEDREWTDFARGLTFAIGLWQIRGKIAGLGQFDLAAGGQGDMSAWTKLALGWLNDTKVATVSVFPTRRIVSLTPIEEVQASNFAVRLSVGGGGGEYFIEARQPMGYDETSLQEYGVLVLFVPSGNSSISFRATLQPNNVGRSVYLDTAADLSVIVLNQTKSEFYLLVGSLDDGRDAQRTLYAMSRASDAVLDAISANRIEGLDLAQKLLDGSHVLFSEGRFREAEALALSAETTANSASIPQAYQDSVTLIKTAEDLKSQVQHLVSSQAVSLTQQGGDELEAAKQAFVAKNFTAARDYAQSAINLFNRARQIDLTERVLGLLGNLALVIPVAIMVYALRYQLKNK